MGRFSLGIDDDDHLDIDDDHLDIDDDRVMPSATGEYGFGPSVTPTKDRPGPPEPQPSGGQRKRRNSKNQYHERSED